MPDSTVELERRVLPQVVDISQVLEVIQDRLDDIERTADGAPAVGTRSGRVAQAAVPRALTEDERKHIQTLALQVGATHLPSDVSDLQQYEIDNLMFEILRVRDLQDFTKGRHDAIKQAVYNAMDVRNSDADDPSLTSAVLPSPEAGHKFVREVRGGKAIVDWLALEGVVDAAVWKRIERKVETTVKRYGPDGLLSEQTTIAKDVDYDEILRCINEGSITMEQVQAVSSLSPRVPYFHIRELGPEDR